MSQSNHPHHSASDYPKKHLADQVAKIDAAIRQIADDERTAQGRLHTLQHRLAEVQADIALGEGDPYTVDAIRAEVAHLGLIVHEAPSTIAVLRNRRDGLVSELVHLNNLRADRDFQKRAESRKAMAAELSNIPNTLPRSKADPIVKEIANRYGEDWHKAMDIFKQAKGVA